MEKLGPKQVSAGRELALEMENYEAIEFPNPITYKVFGTDDTDDNRAPLINCVRRMHRLSL